LGLYPPIFAGAALPVARKRATHFTAELTATPDLPLESGGLF
jgi:hypothetical protein